MEILELDAQENTYFLMTFFFFYIEVAGKKINIQGETQVISKVFSCEIISYLLLFLSKRKKFLWFW